MEFINDNFLLESETVHELYQEHAQDQPIIDTIATRAPSNIYESPSVIRP